MATAEAPAEVTSDASAPAPAAKPKRAKKERTGISVALAPDLRTKLDAEAAEKNVTVRVLVSQKLHAEYGVAMPTPRSRAQYANPEDRKAASKERRMTRAALVKNLLAKHAAEQAAQATA